MNINQWPLNPGDLIYTLQDDGTVNTETLWTVDANDGPTPVAVEMPPGVYETVWVRCDGTCEISDCVHGRTRHAFLLSAQDYVHASRAAEFEVTR
jgi:hypothetical protein